MSRRPSLTSPFEGMNTVPGKLRSLVGAQKPEIKICLHSRQSVYSTMDKVDGEVSITPFADVPFSDIDIDFVGTSRTYVERLTTAAAVSGRAEAFHQFLKLQQPGLEKRYPSSGILEAGVTYKFPFVFVIPQHLLPRVCQHRVLTTAVRDAHICLPPTFGDKDLHDCPAREDDMAPEMASIRYGIFAKINRLKYSNDEAPFRVVVASKARNICVLPAFDERPPMDINPADTDYCIRKERTIRKGVLKGKSGTLVMEVSQPPSLQIDVGSDSPVTTTAAIKLRFDPHDDACTPPKLGSLVNKIKAITYFASSARHRFPGKNDSALDLTQGLHAEQMQLSQRCVANVEWSKNNPTKQASIQRRDSACSVIVSDEEVSPSTHYKGHVYYTARIIAPITLPSNKTFVPTFHSCLVSRDYLLKLELGVPASGGMGVSMNLRVPIQISSKARNGNLSPGRRQSLASEMEQDFNNSSNSASFFEPRMMRVPRPDFVGNSRIGSRSESDSPATSAPSTPVQEDLPPGYSPFGTDSVVRVPRVPGLAH